MSRKKHALGLDPRVDTGFPDKDMRKQVIRLRPGAFTMVVSAAAALTIRAEKAPLLRDCARRTGEFLNDLGDYAASPLCAANRRGS
jgi:hypothetical protein